MSPRKKSSDDYRPYMLDNSSATASDIQRHYYQQHMKDNERKKSAGSSGSHKKRENGKVRIICTTFIYLYVHTHAKKNYII